MASRGLITSPSPTPCLRHLRLPRRHVMTFTRPQSAHEHLRRPLRLKTGIPTTVADVGQATDDGPDVENTAALPYTGKRAVVVGAGPSGTICAMLLAEKGFDVQVFEKRPHPDDVSSANHRSIPITLNPRVSAAVMKLGMTLAESGFKNGIHKGGPSAMISKDGVKYVRISTDGDCIFGERHAIAFDMIKTAEAKGLKNLNFIFNASCKGLDISSKEVEFEGSSGLTKVSYDLLIGADGVSSVVREALQQQGVSFEVSKIPTSSRYISFRNLPPLEDTTGDLSKALKPGCLAFNRIGGVEYDGKKAPRAIVAYVTEDGKYNGSVLGTVEGFECIKGRELDWLNSSCPPSIPKVWKEMIAEQIADGSVSVIGPVTDSSSLIGPDVALVGDSCHSVTPTFGFGANLAISDSIALSKAMDAGNGDIAEGLKCYNEDWFPHVDSIMSLEKMNPRIEFKEGRTFWQRLWGKFFEFHVLFHAIGHNYLPWLVPQSVYRRFFCSELTSVQALRKFRQEGVLVVVVLIAMAVQSLRFILHLGSLLV